MSKKQLTKEQQKELDKLQEEIVEEAKKVVEDYAIQPSELSGSAIHIDYDSSFLDEGFTGNQWKKVTKPQFLKDLFKEKKKESDNE